MFTVEKTKESFPKYVKIAQKTKHLCFGRFDKNGNMNLDIGIAVLWGGEIIAIEWGGNLTLEQIMEERKRNKYAEFAYIGQVWSGNHNGKSRANFERIINF